MSEANGPERVESGGEEPVAGKPSGRRGFVRLPRRRWARWTLAGAAAVVLGALAGTAVVVADHHGDGMRVRAFAGEGKPFAGPLGGVFRGPNGEVRALKGGPDGLRVDGDGPAVVMPGFPPGAPGGKGVVRGGGKLAPAPLPSVAADQALAKAVAAVPGGKAAGLSVVGREGGGSAWQVEVLGSDGVRHLVTVDGSDGSITGNTVADGR